MGMIEMRITTYNLCNNALVEILGGDIQLTIDSMMRILKEQDELVKQLKVYYPTIVKLLNSSNEFLKELEKKLDEDKDIDLGNSMEVVICWNVINSIDRFIQHFDCSYLYLKELKRKTEIFKEKTNEDSTELELLIESVIKKVSKNYEDGLLEKVYERKNALKEHAELLEKIK